MFYSKSDVIWSLVWIAIFSILALIPFQVGEPENLKHPGFSSSPLR